MLASHNSAESVGDPLTVMKIWVFVSGIYVWEFVNTLDFEWSFIRRHRRYPWTIWIYSVSRLSGLAVIIINLINFYGTYPNYSCQATITIAWAFAALGGFGLSSVLIMLRIYAIWDASKVIMAISTAIWVINLGFQLKGIIEIRAVWVPAVRACAITNVETCRDFYISLLVTDVALLSIMLAGLMRLRRGTGGSFYLWQLLWKQGLIWLAIATVAEILQMLFLFLNVNDTLNLLFLLPSMVAIIIAATRTYRSLINSTSPLNIRFDESDSPNLQKAKHLVASHSKDSVPSVIDIPPNRLEVTIHRAFHVEYPISQTNHYGYPSSDAQLIDQPHELSLGDNVEGRDEKT